MRRLPTIYCFVALAVALAFEPAAAQDDIPKTSGFGGFVLAGPGYFRVASNLIVTGAPLLDDVGSPQIQSIFASPTSESAPAFLVGVELNYTFAGPRTQLFLGNRIEDLLRLDVLYGLGVRQELPDESIVAASVLFTPLELKLWSDPYVEGEDRKQTALNFPGFRLRWGRIRGTGLELTLTDRFYRFDDEESGDWLVGQGRLNPDEQPLLNRDGDVLRVMALYRIDRRPHRFEPAIRYVKDAHNGGAMANNGFALQLTYLYLSPKVVLDANIVYGYRRAEKTHPVYGERLEANRWGAAVTAFIPVTLFETSGWSMFVSGEIFRENANIEFFDSGIGSINAGLLWRYKRQ